MVKVKNTKNTVHNSTIMILSKELFFVLFVMAVVFILQPTRADAATFNVATGSDAVNDGDSICQLEEAILNINDGARTYEDCEETGAYGTDDTINLPAGMITGSGWAPLYRSAKIIGDPSGTSIINNRGLELYGSSVADLTLQNFTMTGQGIYANGSDHLTIEGVEVDLQGNSGAALSVGDSHNIEIRDSYFHNAGDSYGFGIEMYAGSGTTSTVNIERTTISDIESKGIILYSSDEGAINATIKNTTITNITGNTGSDFNLGASSAGIAVSATHSSSINYTTINNTFSNISNAVAGDYLAAAIMEFGFADGAGHTNHTAQNDLYAVGNGSGSVNYLREILDGSGVDLGAPTFTTTSLGGNVSSDNSFGSSSTSYLNQPTDKHNQTSLASFLGALSDNGGSVPTLALLEGSPAIDAGTNVAGMTADARGAARPQGNAFDAGAYESAFSVASASSTTDSQQDTLASTGQNTRLAAFTASLLALGGATLSQVRKLKSRAKSISLR